MVEPSSAKLDAILSRTFRASLVSTAQAPLVFLSSLSQELQAERPDEKCYLDKDMLERMMFARLSMAQVGEETPFQYIIGCYRRSFEESRKVSSRDKEFAQLVSETMIVAQELIVSYSGLLLNPAMEGMFPQPSEAQRRGPAQLADHLLFDPNSSSPESLPPGFLEQFVVRFQDEGLDDMMIPVITQVSLAVRNVSPLGNFHRPLNALCQLCASPITAQLVANHPKFMPNAMNGRSFESESLFGPFLKISTAPDIFSTGLPSVLEQCFSNLQTRRQVEINASISALRTNLGTLQSGLHQCFHSLLKAPGCREKVLAFIAAALKLNMGRSKMQADMLRNGTHGFFSNFSVIMLKLCSPFFDPTKADRIGRIDVAYATESPRIDFLADETKVAASSEEAASWVDKRNTDRQDNLRDMQALISQRELARAGSSATASTASEPPASPMSLNEAKPGDFHFICECFFLTSATLHIGLIKVVSECMNNIKEMHRQQRSHAELERMRDVYMGGPGQAEYEQRLQELKDVLAKANQERLSYETVLQDPQLIGPALGYTRLTAALLLKTVGKSAGGPMTLPLPLPCPIRFAMLPEFLVEDITELLLYVSRFSIKELGTQVMDEIMEFLVVFTGSPMYIKNPYLRSKFVEVLRMWIPAGVPQGVQPPPENLVRLFETNALTLEHLVPHLLALYVDIEFTGSHTQFYDKFNIRYHIGELLEYLWNIPAHQQSWKKLAEKDPTFYIRFINMLINDAIFLLDESLNKLPEIKELEAQMENTAAWALQPQAVRQEREATLNQSRRMVQSDLTLANVHIRMMQYTTTKITATFLLPEMVERIAGMLDYFMMFLAGPERKKLRIKDPERLGFKPKELLTQITDIYLHLTQGDPAGVFHEAVARDARSYRDQVFVAAAEVLRTLGLQPEANVRAFEAFSEKVRGAAAADQEEEEVFGEIPEDFLDAIQCTLMRDPVILPTSGQTLDRATIQRHLLSEQRDPFNRMMLTVEMLKPDTELKAKIEAWIHEQKTSQGVKRSHSGEATDMIS